MGVNGVGSGETSHWGEDWEGGLPPMFLGTHTPKLDDKGRVILPAKFRDPLADGLILTKGQERCIVVWTKQSFDDYATAWQAYLGSHEQAFADIDGEVVPPM